MVIALFQVCNIDGEFPIGTSYNGITKDLEPTETRSTSYLKKRAVPEEGMKNFASVELLENLYLEHKKEYFSK